MTVLVRGVGGESASNTTAKCVVIFTFYCFLFGDTHEYYLFCPVLPVMVSGLGMSPGKHLQMGFPSLKTKKCANWWLILYQIVVKKSHLKSGFFIK